MSTLRNTMRTLTAGMHRLIGIGWYHLGRYERARRRFQRVLELKGDDFPAYVYLGRLAYSLGDYAGWRRECEHARRTSPERFARLKHPFELHESRTTGTVFEEAGERASWRVFRVTQFSSGSHQPDQMQSLGIHRLEGDDFSSDEERRRFRNLAPLLHDDIVSVDLEDLARRLIS